MKTSIMLAALVLAIATVAQGQTTINCQVGVPCPITMMIQPASSPTQGPTVTPTPTQAPPTPTPTSTPTATPTPPPTPSPTPTPPPTPTATPTPAAPTHFSTLTPGAALPTEAQCTAWVNAIPLSEEVPSNAVFNSVAAVPSAGALATYKANPNPFKGDTQGMPADYAMVSGSFTGSTDMMARWAACKYGIDEDVVRAQMENESGGWIQSGHGDQRTTQSACVQSNYPGMTLWNTTISLIDGTKIPCANCCYQSWGVSQNKIFYAPTAFPAALNSTAMTLDITYANWRSCYIGNYSTYFASSNQQPNTYAADVAAGNASRLLWGCVGTHFSGDWYGSGAQTYIAQVQAHQAARDWPGGRQ